MSVKKIYKFEKNKWSVEESSRLNTSIPAMWNLKQEGREEDILLYKTDISDLIELLQAAIEVMNPSKSPTLKI
jgi:hypothetical protein